MNVMTAIQCTPKPMVSARQSVTFQELIDMAEGDSALLASRRHNVTSSLRRICALLRLDPATAIASHESVRHYLDAFEPLRAGIKLKRFQNIRSDVNFALARYVLGKPRGKHGLAPAWQILWKELRHPQHKIVLPSFIRFCNDRGIRPDAVSNIVATDYGFWICNETLRANPRSRYRSTILAWNKAAESIATWPKIVLKVPSFRKNYCLPWEVVPASLRIEVEAYLADLANPDPFSPNAPPRPARPKSIESYRFQIRQLVSALAIQGTDIQKVTRLADLVAAENANLALRFFYERTPKQVKNLALLLHKIGKHWCRMKEPELEHLEALKRRLSPKNKGGMTAKNRERLRPFTDIRYIEAILLLPQQVYERIKRIAKPKRKDLVDIQMALTVELLLMAPIRRANLVTLRIGPKGHIRQGQDRKGTTHIVIPGDEVKNGEDLEFPLPKETASLLGLYLKNYRPLLPHPNSAWLFPGEGKSGHRSFDQFSRQFTKTLRRLTGLTVNMHLMRHLGAKLYLDRNPGAYEVIRRVLAHRNMSTTMNSYTGTEIEAAVRHFDSVILDIRNRLLQSSSHD